MPFLYSSQFRFDKSSNDVVECNYLKKIKATTYDLNDDIFLFQSLAWRRKNRVDLIREEFESEVMNKYYAVNHIGWDKIGQPGIFLLLFNYSFDCIVVSQVDHRVFLL